MVVLLIFPLLFPYMSLHLMSMHHYLTYQHLPATTSRLMDEIRIKNLPTTSRSSRMCDAPAAKGLISAGLSSVLARSAKNALQVGASDRFILERLRGSSISASDRSYQVSLRFPRISLFKALPSTHLPAASPLLLCTRSVRRDQREVGGRSGSPVQD